MLKMKYLLEKLIKGMLKVFRLFPVVSNRVIFQSFSGRQYSDSPKAVSDYLRSHYPSELEMIWAFRDPDRYDYLKNEGIITVRYKSLRYLYYALTCRVYVDNVEHWSILRFRPGQQVINTWHGGGTFKQVGADRRDIGELEKEHVIEKMDEVDWFVSTSRAFSEQTLRGSFHYRHEILECGMPRNDRLISGDESGNEELRKRLGLNGKKAVLYAPTFRNSLSAAVCDLDENRLVEALSERFGGQWQLLVRWHYYLEDAAKPSLGRSVDDETDMQQLLMISDVLVSDYSSCIWDYSILKKPCFLYAPDLKIYQQERTFYSDPSLWPAILAESNEQLAESIRNYDEGSYLRKVEEYHRLTGIRESGEAAETIGKLIHSICSGSQ
ncbi:MAG: CDP-glycerol glycerophosphotransferase family protein [Erysipelotrichaceae bacterium]|nr:CDP-glycerol glycerophosphotransferase family protein [Erysipelotrichaceae bacterium]